MSENFLLGRPRCAYPARLSHHSKVNLWDVSDSDLQCLAAPMIDFPKRHPAYPKSGEAKNSDEFKLRALWTNATAYHVHLCFSIRIFFFPKKWHSFQTSQWQTQRYETSNLRRLHVPPRCLPLQIATAHARTKTIVIAAVAMITATSDHNPRKPLCKILHHSQVLTLIIHPDA